MRLGQTPKFKSRGSRYSPKSNRARSPSKMMVGRQLKEMLPFLGDVLSFSGGVYIHFSYHVTVTLRKFLGRVGSQEPIIFDSISVKGGDIDGFFSMKLWAVDRVLFPVMQR